MRMLLILSGGVKMRCDSGSTGCNFAYFYYNSSNGDPYTFKYRNTSTGTVYSANIRWFIWNKSYRRGLRTRGQGGTITEINRLHDGQGWREMPENNVPIGPYHEN